MSAIDHIFTNKEMPSYRSGVITDQLSDHMYTFFELNKVKLIYPPNQRFKETRLINKDSVKLFNDALAAQSWDNVINEKSTEIAYNNYWTTFSELYEICFPIIKKRIN